MILHEAVAKLSTLIPVLKANDAKFASDLIASYKKYGSLTPKQAPWIERLIARAETPVSTPVFSAPLTIPNTVDAVHVGSFAGVIALFNKAKEHLKAPKVNLLVGNLKIVLSVNGPKSKFPGAISISGAGKYPYRSYYGKVTPEGVFQPSYAGHDVAGLTALLSEFSANPARVAKDHGKLTGHCCFCNKVLGLGEDKRSVVVGFGPVCAEHYGLKDQWLQGAAKAEAKASVAPFEPTLAVLQSVQDAAKASLEATAVTAAATLQQGFVNLKIAAAKLGTLTTAATPGLTSLATAVQQLESTSTTSIDTTGQEVLFVTPTPTVSQVSVDELAALLEEPVVCYFCEQPVTAFTTQDGIVICTTCIEQLAGVSDGE